MKISYEWLREYIDTKIKAEKLSFLLTMAGHEVTSIEPKDGDFIFEIEVTPNRADCLCHIGVAREVHAIIKKRLKSPYPAVNQIGQAPTIKVCLEDKLGCLRYSARVINDVRVKVSPKWLIKRIESMGLRPVNNIVDITNFVLFETGQPLHAFDLDKISGNEIIVRRARPGEKITTIDGLERELKTYMLVIADNSKPLAIAGVMGGKDTEVTEDTKNILLESAYFDPVLVRRTALALGLSTDSSYRFERGVDISGVIKWSDRAASLICDIAKGKAFGITDAGIRKKEPNKIRLCPIRVNQILGTELKVSEIKAALKRLDFLVSGTTIFNVAIPSFRNDITKEADLIEEIARVHGYEDIPLKPPLIIKTDEEERYKDAREKKRLTFELLTSLGFSEVITYSLINRQLSLSLGIPEITAIEIQNPLSREQEIMRQSLLPGLLRAVSYNIARQMQNIKIFELSNIYFQKEGVYNEEESLTFVQYAKGNKAQRSDSLTYGLFQLKGAVFSLGERLGIAKLEFEKVSHPAFLAEETLAVLSNGKMLGTLGKIKDEILDVFDIKGDIFATELNFRSIIDHSNLNRFYHPLVRFPSSYRDISFSIDNQIPYKDIARLIRDTGGLLVKEIELLSEYYGEQIPCGKKGLAVRVIYQSEERTLIEEEVNKLDMSIRENLTSVFNAILR